MVINSFGTGWYDAALTKNEKSCKYRLPINLFLSFLVDPVKLARNIYFGIHFSEVFEDESGKNDIFSAIM